MNDLNIYQRVNEIKKKVTYVQKDAKITGYKAVTHDQVTAVLRETMVNLGVVVTESLVSSTFVETGDLTGKGNKWMMYTGIYMIRFVNIDKPEDFIEVKMESQALDTGDKASGKAMSYAVKYAMLKVFSLETGENEEGRQEDFKARRESKEFVTPAQIDQIGSLIDETDADKAGLLKFFKIHTLEELTVSKYPMVINMLKAKK